MSSYEALNPHSDVMYIRTHIRADTKEQRGLPPACIALLLILASACAAKANASNDLMTFTSPSWGDIKPLLHCTRAMCAVSIRGSCQTELDDHVYFSAQRFSPDLLAAIN